MEVKVEDIIKNVKEWVRNIQKQYSGILQLGGVTEEDKVYRVEFTCKNCMIEVVVDEPDWAPYRNVSCLIVALVNNIPEVVYCWYDSDEDNISDILEQLNRSIIVAINYEE